MPNSGPPADDWSAASERVQRVVYRVRAGQAAGTAFVVGCATSNGVHHTMLATALHVVEGILGNNEVLDFQRDDGLVLSEVMSGPARIHPVGFRECDTALIHVTTTEGLVSEDALLPMPLTTMLPRGAELGWLGYPGLVSPELCFFKGAISGFMEEPPVYLIDGVAINGVSGGPAFTKSGLLVGIVSSYIPNHRGNGVTLPGLMIATSMNLVRVWMQEVIGARSIARED